MTCKIARFEPEVKLKYEKEKIRIAKALKGQGVATSIIATATGLTESQIAEL